MKCDILRMNAVVCYIQDYGYFVISFISHLLYFVFFAIFPHIYLKTVVRQYLFKRTAKWFVTYFILTMKDFK